VKSEFRESFLRDVRKLKDRRLSEMIEGVIGEVEAAVKPSDVPGLKKLKGHSIYFKIKRGDYRFGMEIAGGTVTFVRFLHRKDIYRYFPKP
jgi:mRNA interferase RelE/StbE